TWTLQSAFTIFILAVLAKLIVGDLIDKFENDVVHRGLCKFQFLLGCLVISDVIEGNILQIYSLKIIMIMGVVVEVVGSNGSDAGRDGSGSCNGNLSIDPPHRIRYGQKKGNPKFEAQDEEYYTTMFVHVLDIAMDIWDTIVLTYSDFQGQECCSSSAGKQITRIQILGKLKVLDLDEVMSIVLSKESRRELVLEQKINKSAAIVASGKSATNI
ncbi:hypothetical protein CR513_09212, partial [Mucuna pruriens]